MRLIDADNLKIPNDAPYKASVKRVVAMQPTVEAIPVQALTDAILDKTKVVRCKDCKHSDLPAVLTRKYGKIGTLTCHNRYSPCNNRNINEKDFCSYGKMRTSAE